MRKYSKSATFYECQSVEFREQAFSFKHEFLIETGLQYRRERSSQGNRIRWCLLQLRQDMCGSGAKQVRISRKAVVDDELIIPGTEVKRMSGYHSPHYS